MANKKEINEALQVLEKHELPPICKTLNDKQKAFTEKYAETLNVVSACNESGYTKTYGYQLLRDARVQSYLTYIRDLIDAVSIVSKGQLMEKIGQRVLSNDIKDSDLASLSREIRYLQNYGSNDAITQINIKLPDTYNRFFKESEVKTSTSSADDADIIEEWDD